MTYRGHGAEVTAVSWSPDGLHLASVSDGGVVHLWNATTGKQSGCFTPSDVQHAHLDKAGCVRCRGSLLHSEQNLANERAPANLFQDVFTLEFQEQPK